MILSIGFLAISMMFLLATLVTTAQLWPGGMQYYDTDVRDPPGTPRPGNTVSTRPDSNRDRARSRPLKRTRSLWS
jgi:hypothetical protein